MSQTLAVGKHHAGTMVAAATQDIPVKVCGRSLAVKLQDINSISSLENAIQHMLGMSGQNFRFSDSLGTPICTDLTLRDAVQRKLLPLQASLSDSSIHFIENRIEELTQMQWKLVRDKIQGCATDVVTLARQIADLKDELNAQRNESKSTVDLLRAELVRMMQQQYSEAQTGLHRVSEQTTSIAHLISAEQNKREFGDQQSESQIEQLRHLIDSERISRQRDFENMLATLKEGKMAIDSHKQIHDSFEKQHSAELQEIRRELAASISNFATMESEQMQTFRRTVEDATAKLQHYSNSTLARVSNLENTYSDTSKVCFELESRCTSLEARLNEAVSNEANHFDVLAERLQHLAQITQQVRSEDKINKFNVESAFERMKELEGAVAKNDDESRKLVLQETQNCKDDLQRVQHKIINEQGKQIAELQSKIVDRLHQESSAREAATRQVFEEMEKAMAARIPVAKTSSVANLATPALALKEISTGSLSRLQTPRQSFGYGTPTSKVSISASSLPGYSTPQPGLATRIAHASPVMMTLCRGGVPVQQSTGIASPFAGMGMQSPTMRIRSSSVEVRPRPVAL